MVKIIPEPTKGADFLKWPIKVYHKVIPFPRTISDKYQFQYAQGIINYLGASPQGIQRKKPNPLRRRASGNKTHLMGFKIRKMGRYYQCVLLLLLLGLGCGSKKEKEKAPKTAVPVSTEMTSREKPADSIFNKDGERILFKASGNEPFWGLEITEKSIVFTSLTEGLESFHAPVTEPIKAMDANVKVYRSQPETGSIQVQLAQMLCTDDMSGKVSDHKVEVAIKRDTDPDNIVFMGCGNYRTDYRLYDIWVLEEMGGKSVGKEDFGQQVPYLEINSSQNTFLGHAGCNRMNGKIWNEGPLLRFSEVILTRKACGPENREPSFLQHLGKSTHYEIKENRLRLGNADGPTLVFKKID
jgi:heat shock protein HslJ/uncharacterized membrane protein